VSIVGPPERVKNLSVRANSYHSRSALASLAWEIIWDGVPIGVNNKESAICKPLQILAVAVIFGLLSSHTPVNINNSVQPPSQLVAAKLPQPQPRTQTEVAPVIATPEPKPEPPPPVAPAPVVAAPEPTNPEDLVRIKAQDRGWVYGEWDSLYQLIQNESSWNYLNVNPSSGACGLFQALPCSKISDPTNVQSQIDFGLSYIAERYGSPSQALAFWNSQSPHWY
jgi:hypothetical protein